MPAPVWAHELADSYIKLLYLRARWYSGDTGRFTTRDVWPPDYTRPQSLNGFAYVEGNPINRIDPSGHQSIIDDWLKEPKRAHWLVNFTRFLYSRQGLLRNCALTPDDGIHSSDSVDDLLTDFICEYGPRHRRFSVNDKLTQELAFSESIYELRKLFYEGGARPLGPGLNKLFGPREFILATADAVYAATANTILDFSSDCDIDLDTFLKIRTMVQATAPASITHFLGTYDFEIKLVSSSRVRFVIHNQTDLASGTRIPGRFSGISLEKYLSNPTAYANRPILSILEAKDRSFTIGREGGGSFEQTFIWDEQFLPKFARSRWFPPWPFGLPFVKLLP
jgi:RHS repeat-associated protein